jgi:hypothetical protein
MASIQKFVGSEIVMKSLNVVILAPTGSLIGPRPVKVIIFNFDERDLVLMNLEEKKV